MSFSAVAQRLGFEPGSNYWLDSRRPLASLLFIVPLLVVYEVGVLLLGSHSVRNGADALLRYLLDGLGFGQYFLLPALTVGILLGWHYTTREPWRVSRATLWGMTAECMLLAVALRVLVYFQQLLFRAALEAGAPAPAPPVRLDIWGPVDGTVSFLGAGLYEELLFRLMLPSGAVWILRRWKLSEAKSLVMGVLATSLLFAAAHYVGPRPDTLQLFSFSFRFLAGVFFSLLFVYRGFGIAAGSHAGYDILASLF